MPTEPPGARPSPTGGIPPRGPDLDRPKVVLLDVMGTLVEDPFFEALPRFFGMTLGELIDQKHPTAWVEFERGDIGESELLARFFADGRAVDGPRLKQAMRAAYRWIDGVESLVARVQATGTPMHALSNYPRWFELIEEKLRLSRYLDWTFVSCKTGARKPDERAYRIVEQTLGVPPEACLFVDDREVNCEAAARIGMRTIVFEDAAQLDRAMQEHGFVPLQRP